MSSLLRAASVLSLLALPALAHAGGDACRIDIAAASPVRPTLVSSVAAELAPATT